MVSSVQLLYRRYSQTLAKLRHSYRWKNLNVADIRCCLGMIRPNLYVIYYPPVDMGAKSTTSLCRGC